MNTSELNVTARPLVSVLIPAYNAEKVLERSVQSVLSQTLSNLEVLIIDDCSIDSTVFIAEKLANTDDRIRVIRSLKNVGPGAARSMGLYEASGEWIAVLDADDSYCPTRLEDLVRVAQKSDTEMIADNLQLIDPGNGQCVGRSFPIADHDQYIVTPKRMVAHAVPAGRINLGWCQPLINKEFLDIHAIEWRPYRHAEDFLFYMEVLLAGGKFMLVGQASYCYTQRRGSVSRMASPHSRTIRSVAEQQSVILDLLDRCSGQMEQSLRSSLRKMVLQIEVASALIDLRDAWYSQNYGSVLRALVSSLSSPIVLLSCVLARYGPRSNTLT